LIATASMTAVRASNTERKRIPMLTDVEGMLPDKYVLNLLIDWLMFNSTSTQKDQFVPTGAENSAQTANDGHERQYIIITSI